MATFFAIFFAFLCGALLITTAALAIAGVMFVINEDYRNAMFHLFSAVADDAEQNQPEVH
jgi:P pilus assembly chaperone PapD